MSRIGMTYVRNHAFAGKQGPNFVTVPVQNYITAIIVILIIEQLMTWGFYGMNYNDSILDQISNDIRLPKPSWRQCA